MSRELQQVIADNEEEPLQFGHVRAKLSTVQQTRFFCRLCGQYKIKNRKSHLQKDHNADYRRAQSKSYDDILKVIFVESKN